MDMIQTVVAFMSGLFGLFIFIIAFYLSGVILGGVYGQALIAALPSLTALQQIAVSNMFGTLLQMVLISFIFGAVGSIIIYWFLIGFLQRATSYQV